MRFGEGLPDRSWYQSVPLIFLQGLPSGKHLRRLHRFSHWPASRVSRSDAHLIRGMIDSRNPIPSSVRKYSTRGGISEKDSRPTKCSSCSSRNVSESVFGLTPCSSDIRALNLIRPEVPSLLMMSRAHFLDIVVRIPPNAHTHRVSLSSHIFTSPLHT